MIETIIAKAGVPILLSILREVLEKMDSPASQGAAKALKTVDEAIKSGQISPEQIAEANRHTERMAEIKAQQHGRSHTEINKTLRTEVASQDRYVRRMRPTFGYMMALTWAAQMFGIAYVIVFDTPRAGEVMAAMASLSAIWAVGLSVLGVYVYKRSDEKQKNGAQEVIFWNDKAK